MHGWLAGAEKSGVAGEVHGWLGREGRLVGWPVGGRSSVLVCTGLAASVSERHALRHRERSGLPKQPQQQATGACGGGINAH